MYLKYKSGWIEQGGIGTGGGYKSSAKCTFPLPFSDTNYSVVALPVTKAQGNVSKSIYFSTFDEASAIVTTSFNGANGIADRYCWIAYGY